MALFKSKEERRLERDMKIRQGIRRIEKAITEQNKFSDEFVKNARQARQIGDQASYQFIRNSLKKTATIRKLLERQLLAVKNALLIKRQAEASADFAQAMSMMAGEVSRLYGDTDLVKTQMDWEKAMMQSQSMEERMQMFLDSIEQGAAADVSAAPAEAITDEEIDRMIAAEEQVSDAREAQQMSALRAELNALKGEGQKETKQTVPEQPTSSHSSRASRHRVWRGKLLHPVDEAYMFFNDEGPVPETLRRLQKHLTERGIPHVFIGATALNAYRHERMTRDIDVCVRREDLERFRREFVGKEYQTVPGRPRRFYDPVTQVTVDMLITGEVAGNTRKQQKILFPDPAEAQLIEHVPVPSLPRLIELKLVTWRYKDWADVVELIRNNALDESFSQQVDPVVRTAYLQCYDQKLEEDRYNPEIHDAPPAEDAGQ